MKSIFSLFIVFTMILFTACQQQDLTTSSSSITYSDSIYSARTYVVLRDQSVLRNGFGMDIYHEGNAALDSMYLSTKLPAWHPYNATATGVTIKRYNIANKDSVTFAYDLLFYNESAYTKLSTGDYSGTGYPVIFMYTDPNDDSKSTKALMVGKGISYFNAFNSDSVTKYKNNLKSDPLVNLQAHKISVNISSVKGTILLVDSAVSLYSKLVIGQKFRPTIGGVFSMSDASDATQINYQPVFLIRTREGLYAKFMVTRYMGTGTDKQKLTLMWKAIKTQ